MLSGLSGLGIAGLEFTGTSGDDKDSSIGLKSNQVNVWVRVRHTVHSLEKFERMIYQYSAHNNAMCA